MDSDDDLPPRRSLSPRSPLVAAVLSAFIFPGLGQVYCGRGRRALVVIAATVTVTVVATAAKPELLALALVGSMLVGAVDAFRLARQ
jgi:TM2 domain-containing membrane protein YozV